MIRKEHRRKAVTRLAPGIVKRRMMYWLKYFLIGLDLTTSIQCDTKLKLINQFRIKKTIAIVALNDLALIVKKINDYDKRSIRVAKYRAGLIRKIKPNISQTS
jgi:hypothetical protein